MPISLNNTETSLNIQNLKPLLKHYKNPFWVYDEIIIKNKIKELKQFDIIRFAQKACSNINILKLMKKLGIKVDAVSLGEIERAIAAGFDPQKNEIIFTADVLDNNTLNKIIYLNIPVNAGSIDMLDQLGKVSPYHSVWLRINPRFGHGHSKKTNTGGENSKHGIWNIDLALKKIKKYKLKLVGIHMHIGSGVDYNHLQKVCNSMVEVVCNLNEDITSISAGGGLPIPYKLHDKPIDIKHYFNIWNCARKKIEKKLNHEIQLEIEPGRFLVGESGLLISKVLTVKKAGDNTFILTDVGFNDLARPTMYGSYHHISIICGDSLKIKESKYQDTIVGGPLCESGDIFTQTEKGDILKRKLPESKRGDYLIFHDTGAYGASMSSNYNSRPLIQEILFTNGIPIEIRRKQTILELIELEKIYNVNYMNMLIN